MTVPIPVDSYFDLLRRTSCYSVIMKSLERRHTPVRLPYETKYRKRAFREKSVVALRRGWS